MHRTAPFVATTVLLVPSAFSQSLNVDMGVGFGGPTATYAGAAAQAGVWNTVAPIANTPVVLNDLTGVASTVTVELVPPFGAVGEFFGLGLVPGEDGTLLEDFASGGTFDVRISGLQAGSYDMWVYAMATDNSSYATSVIPVEGAPDTVGGAWSGAHEYSVSFMKECVPVVNGTIEFRIEDFSPFSSLNGFQLVQRAMPCENGFPESCHGDGGGAANCQPCSCNNDAPPGTRGGCLNSVGESARLLGSGSPSASADTLRMRAKGIPPSSFALLVSGDTVGPTDPLSGCAGLKSGLASPLFDGLRCVVGAFRRHGVRGSDLNGDIGAPGSTAGWGPPDGPAAGLIAQGGFVAGQTRHYQLFYRDVAHLQFCDTEQNTSQAVSVEFVP